MIDRKEHHHGRLLAGGLAVVLSTACAAPWVTPAPPKARLIVPRPPTVRVSDSVTVRFDQPVDARRLQVELHPAAAAAISRARDRLVISPIGIWQPEQRYAVTVTGVTRADHRSPARKWEGSFVTQKNVSMAFQVDGQPVVGAARLSPRSHLQLTFSTAMRTASVVVTQDGRPLPTTALAWAPDGTSVGVNPTGLLPYRPVSIAIGADALSESGDWLTQAAPLVLTQVATVAANSSTGVGAGFRTQTPIEIVVENSGSARPQAGLQDADLVYEYLSEYGVTRMTAIYLNRVPELVGPVRSCRMVNPYLGYAYAGITMCSGGSVGTLHWMFGSPQEGKLVANLMEAFDEGGHYFRTYLKAPPHNLYTSGDRAERLRSEQPLAPIDYAVDLPHEDVDMGNPTDSPAVPLHSVGYSYDGSTRQYLRTDHDTPFFDENTNAQLHVKNVVVMHVPFHYTNWVEDETGGAEGVWYDLLGTGPAEIYSNGRLLQATWHMGSAPGQWYYDNHTPLWFTDSAGNVILLNTGLTWVHVVGNGQT